MPRINHEEIHQISLFRFLDVFETQIPSARFAFHPPNGGYRARTTAARLKKMGVKSGVPDVMIPIQNNQFVGLAIELKHGNNTVSIHQREWIATLRDNGWSVWVLYDWVHAAAVICQYFDVDPTRFGLHPYLAIPAKETTNETT